MARVIAVGQAAFEGQGDFTPIPAGTKLKVSVYDVKEGVAGPNSKNPGSPQFEWTAKVTEDGQFKGREIRYNYVPLDPNVGHAWNLSAFAKAVGWKTDSGKGTVEVPDDLSDVLGTEVIAKVSQTPKDDQDRIFNRVDRVFPLPKGGGGGGGGITEKAKPTWNDLN